MCVCFCFYRTSHFTDEKNRLIKFLLNLSCLNKTFGKKIVKKKKKKDLFVLIQYIHEEFVSPALKCI